MNDADWTVIRALFEGYEMAILVIAEALVEACGIERNRFIARLSELAQAIPQDDPRAVVMARLIEGLANREATKPRPQHPSRRPKRAPPPKP